MNTISAQTVLLAILAMAGLSTMSSGPLHVSEKDGLTTLAIISGRKVDQIDYILKVSRTRKLNQSEAQFLHELKKDGAQFLVAGRNPMY